MANGICPACGEGFSGRHLAYARTTHLRQCPAERARHSARMKVRWAVVSGRLRKPDECERCGARVALTAHHRD